VVKPTDIGRIVKASDTVTYQKVGPTMFEILWNRMDELVAWYYNADPNKPYELHEVDQAVGEMRGIAFAIREWSSTWYQEPNAVAKHAKRRYEAAVAGEPMPDTVGCNGYNPLPVSRAPRGFKDISKPKVMPLSPEAVKQIKAGLAAGFKPQDLADLYKVDLPTVEAQR
jgi:hypothetical protein